MVNIICLMFLVLCFGACQNDVIESKPQTPLMQQYDLVRDVITSREGTVKNGQGLYQALEDIGIDNRIALELINSLRDEVEFSTLKAGDNLEGLFNQFDELIEFRFGQNLVETHVVKKENGQWKYSLIEKPTFWETRIVEGNLQKNSTLQSDLEKKGLSPSVVNEIISVLLCKVNFRMNARHGDKYKVLLDERKYKDKIISTNVLYTFYEGERAGKHEAFYYQDEERSSTYSAHYTSEGEALIRSGLRYPLSSMHVRSNYGWRRHPVTGKKAFHRGIDLRGKSGRPVYAVARGRVISAEYDQFAGNKIAIKHEDKSTSFYFHLKNSAVKKGAWVKAGQMIGRVGATGRVTGAHLHFGFKNAKGKWINPLNKRMIATPKLAGNKYDLLQLQILSIKKTMAEAEMKKQEVGLMASLGLTEQSLNIWPDDLKL